MQDHGERTVNAGVISEEHFSFACAYLSMWLGDGIDFETLLYSLLESELKRAE